MINSDYLAIEKVILERISRITESYKKTYGNDLIEVQEMQLSAATKPLRETLLQLKKGYFVY